MFLLYATLSDETLEQVMVDEVKTSFPWALQCETLRGALVHSLYACVKLYTQLQTSGTPADDHFAERLLDGSCFEWNEVK